jgi:hypothetical protein
MLHFYPKKNGCPQSKIPETPKSEDVNVKMNGQNNIDLIFRQQGSYKFQNHSPRINIQPKISPATIGNFTLKLSSRIIKFVDSG